MGGAWGRERTEGQPRRTPRSLRWWCFVFSVRSVANSWCSSWRFLPSAASDEGHEANGGAATEDTEITKVVVLRVLRALSGQFLVLFVALPSLRRRVAGTTMQTEGQPRRTPRSLRWWCFVFSVPSVAFLGALRGYSYFDGFSSSKSGTNAPPGPPRPGARL